MGKVHCTVADLVSLTSREITPEGYLLAPGTIGTSGNVQHYSADELGLDAPDLKGKKVGLYRPPEEVLTSDCLASFADKPITLNHPPDGVSSTNWRDVAVGDVREVKADGAHMRASLIVRDRKAVHAILDGKQALSNGYSFDLDLVPGKTASGLAYDGIQRNIRGNHVAIVDVARGGPDCRIADKQQGDSIMAIRKVIVDGIPVDLEETAAATVDKALADRDKQVKTATDSLTVSQKALADAEAKVKTLEDAQKKLVTDHEEKVKALEAKILKPEQVEALAAERAKALGDAAEICPGTTFEGKTVAQIRTTCLTAVLAGDSAEKPIAIAVLAGVDPVVATDAASRAAFDAVVAAHAAIGSKSTGVSVAASASSQTVARAFAGGAGSQAQPTKLSGRDLAMARMKAWGTLPGEKATS